MTEVTSKEVLLKLSDFIWFDFEAMTDWTQRIVNLKDKNGWERVRNFEQIKIVCNNQKIIWQNCSGFKFGFAFVVLPGWRWWPPFAWISGAIDLATVEDDGADVVQTFDQVLEDAIVDELVVGQVEIVNIWQSCLQFFDFFRLEQRQPWNWLANV
jgi:hypothetical protein